MQEINRQLLIYLNSFTDIKIIENIALAFSDTPIFFLPIFLVSYWLYFTFKKQDNDKKNDLLLIFYSIIIAIITSIIIQQFVNIDRPETALEASWKFILSHLPDASFPSDHATVSISFLVALFLANYKKIWLLFSIAVILMNLSRVTLGVHWPFDIIWWAVVWISSSFFVFKVLKTNKYIISLNNFIIKMMSYIKL